MGKLVEIDRKCGQGVSNFAKCFLHLTLVSKDFLFEGGDLLTSLRHPVRLIGSHFIHPSLPVSSFSRTGSGPDVEGFTSGRPNPRLALRAIMNMSFLYKYITTTSPAPHLKGN